RFLCAHLQLHQDELSSVLGALKRLGYAVNTENGDADQWVLACDQREATIGPLIDELLLDREQPGLAMEPLLLDAISVSLTQAPRRLADLFDEPGSRGGEILPESAHMVQNTPIAEHRNTQEKNH